MFRQGFRTFLERNVVPHREKWEQAGIVDKSLFLRPERPAFSPLTAPEPFGSAITDFRYNVIVIEEAAQLGVLTEIIGMTLHNDVCLPYFLSATNDEQKARWLPGICDGSLITAVAMTEPTMGSDLAAMRTTAVLDGDQYVINGSKTFITPTPSTLTS